MSNLAQHDRTNYLLDRLLAAYTAGSSTGGSLEVTQLSVLTTVQSILTTLRDFEETVLTDDSNTVFIRRVVLTEATGVYTVTYTLFDGSVYIPTTGIRPVSSSTDVEMREVKYIVINSGTGYSIDDIITKIDFYDVTTVPATLVTTVYLNDTLNTVITPLFADLEIYESGLTATAANQVIGNTYLQTISENSVSKIDRIKGANDYTRFFVYDDILVIGSNVTEITHTGTTVLGIETVVETITYVDPTLIGSNIISITYS